MSETEPFGSYLEGIETGAAIFLRGVIALCLDRTLKGLSTLKGLKQKYAVLDR